MTPPIWLPYESVGSERQSHVNGTTIELVRREVGKLLRVDSRGEFICSSCLKRIIGERSGTAYTKGQIERALEAVFKSPGALTRKYSFVCDRYGNTMACLGVPAVRF